MRHLALNNDTLNYIKKKSQSAEFNLGVAAMSARFPFWYKVASLGRQELVLHNYDN